MSQSSMTKADKPAKKKNELVETIVVIVEALLIALVFRTFLYQPFSIPTASMQSTLMIGDYFVASKFTWGFGKYSFPIALPFNGRLFGGTPERGDVAVFRNEITGEDYIKRVIGLPGDRIQMQEGRLYINGEMVPREEITATSDVDSEMRAVPVKVYRETLPNGVSHTIQEIADNGPLDNTAEYLVPAGHYFMMGDNREHGRLRAVRQFHRQGRGALLLHQGQYSALAALAVAGECALGPHVPGRRIDDPGARARKARGASGLSFCRPGPADPRPDAFQRRVTLEADRALLPAA